MAEFVTIARPYAKAAFQFAREISRFKEWAEMLQYAAAVASNEQMSGYLDNPRLTAAQRGEMFLQVCGEKLDDHVQNLVLQLAKNKRLAVLPQICELYKGFLAEESRSEQVQVSSAYQLTAEQQLELERILRDKLGKKVTIQSAVDETLIGGVVIRAGDLVIDNSVRGKLARLANAIK
ncbi:MAG: F0F1 ATP synthase subunit delta [Pseudomonadales bacterium]|nr:F0F1 ATP synthase subunit delta [Pseudomonadales bacterium]